MDSRKTFTSCMAVGLLVLLMLGPAVALALDDSGRIMYLRGDVNATDPSGAVRALQRDDRVYSGDMVESGPRGLAQIVFPDNSMLSIKPNSKVHLEKYLYDKDDPSKDKAVVSVVKGALRGLTGVIGERNPDSVTYKNRTSVIGIRGTAIELGETNVIFDFGRGEVQNEAGKVLLEPGESVRAVSPAAQIRKYLHERDPDDASVIASVLVAAPRSKVPEAAEIACASMPVEEAVLLMGMQKQVDGYEPDVTAGTVEGVTVCFEVNEFGIILTATTRIFQELAPQLMDATLRGKGDIGVSAGLKAILRGLERPGQDLVDEVVTVAVAKGNLDVETARQILRDVRAEGFCR
jgi:hypothetical protein